MASLSEHDFRTWAEEGVELAAHSLRSWEAAVDYFRVSPRGPARCCRPPRSGAGRTPAATSPSTRPSSRRRTSGQPRAACRYLDEHRSSSGPRSASGCTRATGSRSRSRRCTSAPSPGLLPSLTLGEMARLVALVETVAERSYELASACLDAAPPLFASLDEGRPRAVPDAGRRRRRGVVGRRAHLLRALARPARADRADGAQPLPRARGARRAAQRPPRLRALRRRARWRSRTCRKDSHHDLLVDGRGAGRRVADGGDGVPQESSPEVLKRIRISRAGALARGRAHASSSRASRAARRTSASSPARARRCCSSSRRASSSRASARCCACTARRSPARTSRSTRCRTSPRRASAG